MRKHGYGVGVLLAQTGVVLIMLAFAPFGLALALYFRFQDWRQDRLAARAVPGV